MIEKNRRIQLTNPYIKAHKDQCCGCHACFNVCPVKAISMKEDMEGFLYPHIDDKKCIHCGRCAKVCQLINRVQSENGISKKAYACINQNMQERLASSSGGIFILLAKYVIQNKGCVFGAAFDAQMVVRHMKAESIQECRSLMGSKYVQSIIGDTFFDAKIELDKGRLVLFTGTPCQIHGLKLFLGKFYENLITADLICHGTPSPLVLKLCIKEIERKYKEDLMAIYFRDKSLGWKKPSVKYIFSNGHQIIDSWDKSDYLNGFSNNLYLRMSCYQCNTREGNYFSDITIGDYWGVDVRDPDMDDDRGTSIILVHTSKGIEIFTEICDHLKTKSVPPAWVLHRNPCTRISMKRNKNRNRFFSQLNGNGESIGEWINKCYDKYYWGPSRWVRFRNKITGSFRKKDGEKKV